MEHDVATQLDMTLFGGLTLRHGPTLVTGLASRKAEAVVAYLACTRRACARETLAELLWDDRTTAQGLGNLRVVLNSLRQSVLAPHLSITRQTVAFNPERAWALDVADFETHLARALRLPSGPEQAALLETGVAWYRGDFLQGVYFRDSRGFEEWAVLERERLQQLVINALQHLTDFYLKTGAYATGLTHVTRLLSLDALREEAHRQKMLLLARAGQTAAALAHYEICRQRLRADLDLEPSAETQALYHRLQTAGTLARHTLLAPATAFVGRAEELQQLGQRLQQTDCRLVTLLGPGGIGKTRLALQAALTYQHLFLHSAVFVPLVAVTTPEQLGLALATALPFELAGKQSPREQVLNYLRGKEMLLVLDNFEQVGDGALWVNTLLQTAPGVKVLVTSRERLNLSAEWLMTVGGLLSPAPNVALTEAAETSAAVQLFMHSARRAHAEFEVTPANLPAVLRICHALGGLPLGIELAAAWIRTLSCAEIADEIEGDADFLSEAGATPLASAPDRQRSLRVVFDHSWARLSATEQAVFAALCWLRGGFRREAAGQVAEATPAVLRALTDKSLLTRAATGRYTIHEYLRQYGETQLTPQRAGALERLAEFVAAHLQALEPQVLGGGQATALDDIGEELENVRVGWEWAVAQHRFDIVQQALDSLSTFFIIRGWHQSGAALFGRAAATLERAGVTTLEQQRLLGRLLGQQAQCCEFFAPSAQTQNLFEQSLAWLQRAGQPLDQAIPLRGLGYQALVNGQYAQAITYLEASLAAARAAHHPVRMAAALNTLAQVIERQGDYARARALCEESLALRRAAGNALGIINSLNYLGLILNRLADYAAATQALDEGLALSEALNYRVGLANLLANRAHSAHHGGQAAEAEAFTRRGLALYRDIGDEWGEAIAINNLGYLAADQKHYAEAKAHYAHSLSIYQRTGIQSGWASTLANLGLACVATGDYGEARAHLRAALEKALALGAAPVMLKALLGWAQALIAFDQRERAGPLVEMLAHHPATEPPHRAWAATQLAPSASRPTWADSTSALAAIVEALLQEGELLNNG